MMIKLPPSGSCTPGNSSVGTAGGLHVHRRPWSMVHVHGHITRVNIHPCTTNEYTRCAVEVADKTTIDISGGEGRHPRPTGKTSAISIKTGHRQTDGKRWTEINLYSVPSLFCSVGIRSAPLR